jgi:hypothetical protein
VIYNDIDPFTNAWLEELIDAGHLPQGNIDARSIADLEPEDCHDTTHFFAGIGGWPLALKLAGWPEDQPVWTGSCPCQPFSSAGKRKGTDDERHLWPEMRRLIATCNPPTIFGEQVASKQGRLWLSEVRFDLEHIIYWQEFEKDLHSVRSAPSHEVLSEVLGAICGRVEATVYRLSKGLRKGVEGKKHAEAVRSTEETTRSRQEIQGCLQPKESSTISDQSNQGQVQEEVDSVRLGCPREPVERQDQQVAMRADWPADRDSHRQGRYVEQCVAGSHQALSWLCVLQHPGSLLCRECWLGQLGGGCLSEGCFRLLGTGLIENGQVDERAVTERFRAIIALSVRRLWLAGVRADLEELGYVVGSADLCAAGVGAPHIRQRIFWVGYTESPGTRLDERRLRQVQREGGERDCGVGDADRGRREQARHCIDRSDQEAAPGWATRWSSHTSPWSDVGLVLCREPNRHGGVTKKLRRCPTEPGLFPLAHGVPNRVGTLRGAGNAIVPQVAAEFVGAFMEAIGWASTHGRTESW